MDMTQAASAVLKCSTDPEEEEEGAFTHPAGKSTTPSSPLCMSSFQTPCAIVDRPHPDISVVFISPNKDTDIFCSMKASKKTKSLSGRAAAVKPQKDGYHLPSHDALAQILPGYRSHDNEAKAELQNATPQQQRREATQANKPKINQTYHVHHPHRRPPLHDFEGDPIMAEINDLQTKELENYRSAVSRMAEDIIALRTQVVALETENSRLRTDLSLHQDLGRDLLDDADIAVMTKAEIADRIASLKFKLASETSKGATQRDRIQQLQDELIKKNDREKELIKLTRGHQLQQHQHHQQHQHQQQEDLQHQSYAAKMATLETTVKKQEKVIEKMENKCREKNRPSIDKGLVIEKHRGSTDCRSEDVQSVLAAENSCLHEELDRIHKQPFPVITAQTKEVLSLKERLSLLNKLEIADARVQTLEAQLEENSKVWGKQKQEMLTKLNEHRHGFIGTSSSTILHNVSSVR
ncbi:coiled-coil domain-containing protein 33 [Platichthys flesus]|uniref:coiled-coil domain-containing protein 33 n=1 Tax=Platichthys flesus TaxID=8260 RepID=UPI002DB93E6A|nr:coiled-coil domain-containing protein 33 [Platichthys flesus]